MFVLLSLDNVNLSTTTNTLNITFPNSPGNVAFKSDGTGKDSLTITSQLIANPTFTLPTSFYRLNLLDPNSYYNSGDLLNTSFGMISCSSPNNKFCYTNGKPLYCATNYYYNIATDTCDTSCPAGYMVDYGSFTSSTNPVAITSGFCNVDCSPTNASSIQCETTANFASYTNNFTCTATNTKTHMSCYPTANDKMGALNYSGMFNPLEIDIPISPTQNNYYVEIWYYVDRMYLPPNPVNGAKYYIFYTNSFRIYRDHDFTNNNNFMLEDSAGNVLGTAFAMNYGQWYKLVYEVKFSSPTYSVEFFYNKYTANQTGSSSDISLNQIKFCSTCVNINWFTGFYKDLRVWDSTNIVTSLFKQYDS